MKYFKLKELLPKELYKNEQEGWELLDPKLLSTLDVVREVLGVPLTCNNGGTRNNCGFRAANCPIGAKNSYHKKGMAADLTSSHMTAAQMRAKLIANADRLPYPIRIENSVTWLHIDTAGKSGQKIYLFNP